MKLTIPENVNLIIKELENHGFEAYAVGGCVRDSILHRQPSDWDITTNALPDEMKEIFKRTVDTGIEHGTVTVLIGDEAYELTTYRVDGDYLDGRHPEKVYFTRNLEEDLKRRDFTINAMAYHPQKGIIDIFGGCKDLENKIIKAVGDPVTRFNEDGLRLMRAVRFSAQLGFSIEENTFKAMKLVASNLENISPERINVELVKLLCSNNPEYINYAYETGLTKYFLPEWDRCMKTPQNTPHHYTNVGEHTLKALEIIENDRILRLTMLLHDIAKPVVRKTDQNGRDHFKTHGLVGEKMAHDILRRLKFDNKTIKKVTKLVKYHDLRPEPKEIDVRYAMHIIGEELFPYYLKVQKADLLAQSTYKREKKFQRYNGVVETYNTIVNRKDCVSLGRLDITGTDLINNGFSKGKVIGDILNLLLQKVIEEPKLNKKEVLLNIAKNIDL